jgi:hypothetical protein
MKIRRRRGGGGGNKMGEGAEGNFPSRVLKRINKISRDGANIGVSYSDEKQQI